MHPTLDGLDRAAMVRTLENGLITLSEIDALIALMKNPKVSVQTPTICVVFTNGHTLQSHFLKVPTLPFCSLTSILSKFPAEGDSRVFWSSKLRDLLCDVTTGTHLFLLTVQYPQAENQLLVTCLLSVSTPNSMTRMSWMTCATLLSLADVRPLLAQCSILY